MHAPAQGDRHAVHILNIKSSQVKSSQVKSSQVNGRQRASLRRAAARHLLPCRRERGRGDEPRRLRYRRARCAPGDLCASWAARRSCARTAPTRADTRRRLAGARAPRRRRNSKRNAQLEQESREQGELVERRIERGFENLAPEPDEEERALLFDGGSERAVRLMREASVVGARACLMPDGGGVTRAARNRKWALAIDSGWRRGGLFYDWRSMTRA